MVTVGFEFQLLVAVAYLWYHEGVGGGEFLLAPSAHTKGGKPGYHIFFFGEKKVLAKWGPWPKIS